MTEEPLPAAVIRLIADRFDSIPELEAVLLFRESAQRPWTADEAGRRLYVSTAVAEYILDQLHARGFLAQIGEAYRYQPQTEEIANAVDELAVAYRRHLKAVTNLVHAKPSQNVRDFANAFRLRKPR